MIIIFCTVVLSTDPENGTNTQEFGLLIKVGRYTQYVELHKDDLDHVGQLTRSKHEARGGGDDHLATAMDP
jgi:hypothetical protein